MGKSRNRNNDTGNQTTQKTEKSFHNGKKSTPKAKGGSPKASEGYETTKGSNAFAWHTPDAALLERASETSWSYQTGEVMTLNPLAADTLVSQSPKASQAGIMVIRDQIVAGGAGMWNPGTFDRNFTVPTYQAANSLLTEMRSRARIRNTYDAPDVMMIMLAMANIYAGITWCKRLAATVRAYTYKNQYLPEDLIRVQGVDPEDMKRNQFRFITELNVIISEVNKIYIPNKMHLFELINERFSNYYTEGSDVRDQIYMFTPAFLSAIDFNPTTDYASHIAPIMIIPGTTSYGFVTGTKYNATGLYTCDQILNALRFMVNQVLTNADTPDITGDMENCFGPSERFYLPACDPNSIAIPVMDEEILETIHNMSWSAAVTDSFTQFDTTTAAPYWNTHGVFTTFQNPGDNRIGAFDYFELPNSAVYHAMANSESVQCRILDVHKDPNSQKTFAITRLKNVSYARTQYNSKYYVNMVFSTDLICQVQFYTYEDVAGVPTLIPYNLSSFTRNDGSDSKLNANLEAFHYRPMRVLVDSATYLVVPGSWWDGETDIWAMLEYRSLVNMNRISLLSLLGAYNNI